MNKKDVENIEQLVRAGEHTKVLRELQKLKRGAHIPSNERLLLSDWYLRIGLPAHAIQILGAEAEPNQLKIGDLDFFKVQARLAYMQSYFGANHTAHRILDHIEKYATVILKKNKEFEFILQRYRAGIYVRSYEYNKAEPLYAAILTDSFKKENFYTYQLIKIGWADCFAYQGEVSKAVKIINEILSELKEDQRLLMGIAHQARAEYLIRVNKLSAANKDLLISGHCFSDSVKSRDYAVFMQWQAIYHYLSGNSAKAKKMFLRALQVFSADRYRPQNLFEIYHWLLKINPKLLKNEKFRPIITYPAFTPYSYLFGKPYPQDPRLEPWYHSQIKKTDKNNSDNCWKLEISSAGKVQLSKIHYQSESLQVISVCTNKSLQLIDLYSGAQFKNTWTVISPLRARYLSLLAGAGNLGLNEWVLIDELYPGDWNYTNTLPRRVVDLSTQLKQEGFVIKRKDYQYAWELPKNSVILFAINFECAGVTELLKVMMPEFNRKQIEKFFGIATPTAKVWIKKWLNQELIVKKGSSVYSCKVQSLK